MLPGSSHSRQSRRSTTLLAVFLVGTVALSCVLAVQAYDADRSHRVTAASVLADYAGIAAAEYGRVARADLSRIFDVAFDEVPRRWRPERMPDPVEVVRELDDATRAVRCDCPALELPVSVFRGDAVTGEVQAVHTADTNDADAPAARASPSDRGRASEALARILRTLPSQDPARYGIVALDHGPDGQSGYVLYTAVVDRDARPRVVYGVLVTGDLWTELGRSWYARHEPLPRVMRRDTPVEALVRFEVAETGGAPFFTSHPDATSAGDGEGSDSLGDAYGSLVLRASIPPEAANRLVIGGIPSSRLPFSLGLLALTLAVGLAGLWEVRRHDQLARLREDFISGVSHELRTPLTQIRMLAELQADGKLSTGEERQRANRVMAREATRLTHMVENLLQFGRLKSAGLGPGPLEELSLRACVDTVADNLRPLLAAHSATLDIDVPVELRVHGDRAAIRQILENLLDNALKYGPQGQCVRVLGRGDARGGWRLSVEDEGPGIPAEAKARVWEPYQRLPRDVNGNRPGSGVGLAVVRALALALGARVDIEDPENGGARFVLEVPPTSERPSTRRAASGRGAREP